MITQTRRGEPYSLPVSGTFNRVPIVAGSDHVIHPSVVDMGFKWNGFRWWRGDTPMPEAYEDPSIWASNDRVNWTVPEGLTNPIDEWPGKHANDDSIFNSDTELVWDPVGARMVLFWREVAPTGNLYYAASSRDGSTWLHHGPRLVPPDGAANLSAGIDRDAVTGEWRAVCFGTSSGALYSAPDVLGPWALSPAPLSGWLTSALPYHGDMIYHDGLWFIVAQCRWVGVLPAISTDGIHWTWGTEPLPFAGYRTTMCPSTEPGYFDVWASAPTKYYRVEQSAWTDLL